MAGGLRLWMAWLRTLLLAIEDITEHKHVAEMLYHRLFAAAKDGIIVMDAATGTISDVNPEMLNVTGYPREQFVGKKLSTAKPLHGAEEMARLTQETREKGVVRYDSVKLRTRDHREVVVEIVANTYLVGSLEVIQCNVRDVTEREGVQAALHESERRFRLFVESVQDYALFQFDVHGKVTTWNPGGERLLRYRENEIVGQPAAVLFTPEDVSKGEHLKEMETARREGRAEDERWHIRKDGTRFWSSGVVTLVRDDAGGLRGYAKVMRDITERKKIEEELRSALGEKDVLIREIHHRVKNNLQVITSLLNLQSNHMKDPGLVAAFEETEGRVRAIAQIHERLYASDDLAEVEFAAYLTNLTKQLLMLHATEPDQIALELDVSNLVLRIDQAIPLGLVLNELIVNSLKHGLQGGHGHLQIRLKETKGPDGDGYSNEARWAEVRIADSGPGLPPGLEISKTKSMGYQLVQLLLRQLHGRMKVGPGPGLEITIEFPVRSR